MLVGVTWFELVGSEPVVELSIDLRSKPGSRITAA